MGYFRTIFMPIFESIRIKPTNFLLYCNGLTEEYHDLSFTKNDTINSLKLVRDEINDKDEILDALNDEFLSVGVYFKENKNSGQTPIYKCAGIVSGEYIPKEPFLYIYVNDTFIDNFLNNQFEVLADAIVAISTHEDTHRQQDSLSRGKIKGTPDEAFPINTAEKVKIYLGNPAEIDAHAREAAMNFYNLRLGGKELLNKIKNKDKVLLSSRAYFQYWSAFGIMTNCKDKLDEDGKQRLKIWKRFLKRIIAYLSTTERYKFAMSVQNTSEKFNEE